MARSGTSKSTSTCVCVGAIVGLVAGVYHMEFRPGMLRWGASDAEVQCHLPGDELCAEPSVVSTRAITINAPPASVWHSLMAFATDGRSRHGSPAGDIEAIDEYHYFVIGRSRAFVLEPLGGNRTRLIVRSRGHGWVRPLLAGFPGLRDLGALVDYVVGEPLQHFAQRKMMLDLVHRAEAAWAESL